jgi:hypothetical protein
MGPGRKEASLATRSAPRPASAARVSARSGETARSRRMRRLRRPADASLLPTTKPPPWLNTITDIDVPSPTSFYRFSNRYSSASTRARSNQRHLIGSRHGSPAVRRIRSEHRRGVCPSGAQQLSPRASYASSSAPPYTQCRDKRSDHRSDADPGLSRQRTLVGMCLASRMQCGASRLGWRKQPDLRLAHRKALAGAAGYAPPA